MCKKSGGIAVIYKKSSETSLAFISSESQFVQWMKVSKNIFGLQNDVIVGCIYIPPEGSKYSNLEAFDEIENELMSFKKVSDVHTALIGDFNAKTGILNDFVLADETLLDLFHLDTDNEIISYMLDYENLKSYNIPLQRVTQCSCQPNTYGYKLLNCCKKMNMYIANSRIGVDKGVGKTTCKNTSVVDYLLLSSKLFTLVKEFEIQQVDPLLSDVHSAIHITLKSQSVSHENNSVTSYQTSKTRWHDNKRNQFVNTVHNKKEQLSAILNDLHNLHSSDHCTQHEIDTVVDNIGEILVSSANDTFVKNRGTTTQRTNKKPWYTKKCYDARKKFHKARKQYSLHKNETNHKKLLDFSKQYKQITNKAYNDYQFNLESKIRNTSKINGREFWKILNNFNKKGNDDSNIISMESLYNYFKDLNMNDIDECSNDIDKLLLVPNQSFDKKLMMEILRYMKILNK
ncbi:unnamed protein product [Mytilus coruscus]|uniref:Endonuclease/exonuclease/phosphatase domain-containing protein n=1 Tax=Mytilus coruscus TaxID=42192 RepID=A0A6J8CWL1_MYTCO|nr:unnamed protein product [Mytilus coruscus]